MFIPFASQNINYNPVC